MWKMYLYHKITFSLAELIFQGSYQLSCQVAMGS